MMRNIERLRQEDVMVRGNWFNKEVLFFKETMARNPKSVQDAFGFASKGARGRNTHYGASDAAETIFNLELSDITVIANIQI